MTTWSIGQKITRHRASVRRPPVAIEVSTTTAWETRNRRLASNRLAAMVQNEIVKLSNGIVDKAAEDAIESRRRLAATERAGLSSHYGSTSALKSRLSRVSPTDLPKWITEGAKRGFFTSYWRGGLPAAHAVAQMMALMATASTTVNTAMLVGLNQSQSATKLIRTTTATTAITPGCLQGLRCVSITKRVQPNGELG